MLSGQNCPDGEDYVLADRGNYAQKKLKFLEPYGVKETVLYKMINNQTTDSEIRKELKTINATIKSRYSGYVKMFAKELLYFKT